MGLREASMMACKLLLSQGASSVMAGIDWRLLMGETRGLSSVLFRKGRVVLLLVGMLFVAMIDKSAASWCALGRLLSTVIMPGVLGRLKS